MLTNLALNKPAKQSSTAYASPASRAVDGNTDGNWYSNSVTSTDCPCGSHPFPVPTSWWEVDLGAVQWIDNIKIFNRTDCCSERLSAFYVFVSDTDFTSAFVDDTLKQPGVSAYFTPGKAASPTTISVNRTGRYVRVQLTADNYLSLAEVQVWGQ